MNTRTRWAYLALFLLTLGSLSQPAKALPPDYAAVEAAAAVSPQAILNALRDSGSPADRFLFIKGLANHAYWDAIRAQEA
jgi:hypothetical protein